VQLQDNYIIGNFINQRSLLLEKLIILYLIKKCPSFMEKESFHIQDSPQLDLIANQIKAIYFNIILTTTQRPTTH